MRSKNLEIPNPTRTFGFWGVFVSSFLISAGLLSLERIAGIGWDYHPDSVTYATMSDDVYGAILEYWPALINNGYYVVVHFLGQSVVIVTLTNMLLFALTNGLIYKALRYQTHYTVGSLVLLLLLLNPYRIHLSTTMLKDSLIIFLVVAFVISSTSTRLLSLLAMTTVRLASPLYAIALIPRRFLVRIVIVALIAVAMFWDQAVTLILEFNEKEMRLRDFDTVPTFQELGFWGSVLRGAVWSILSFTGTFALLNPAPAFIPVAIGSVMTLVFVKKVTGAYKLPIQLFAVTFLFGILVTGFTAYIRYIYPILVIWPLVAVLRPAPMLRRRTVQLPT